MNLEILLFDTIINLIQSSLITYFLIVYLSTKKRFNSWVVKIVFTVSLFTYLELQNFMTDFEGFSVFLTLVLMYLLCFAFCNGLWIEKLLYSVLGMLLSVFAAVISGSLVGLYHNIGYMELVGQNSIEKMIGEILTQLLLLIAVVVLTRIRRTQEEIYDLNFTLLTLAVPLISIVVVTILLGYSENSSREIIMDSLVTGGIILMNIIVFKMLKYERIQYGERLKKELSVQAYEQQQHDIDEINRQYTATEKNWHELKRVLGMIYGYLAENKVEDALEYLKHFDVNQAIQSEQILYTKHAVLNYLLNQKIEQCRQNNIDVKCLVSGSINGIVDIDVHILVGNLLDNAMESTKKIKDSYVSVSILCNEDCFCVEICNTALKEALKNNPDFKTTKNEKNGHGYGTQNVRDIVEKYNGSMEYTNENEDIVMCKVVLIKDKTKIK